MIIFEEGPNQIMPEGSEEPDDVQALQFSGPIMTFHPSSGSEGATHDLFLFFLDLHKDGSQPHGRGGRVG